MNALSIIKEKEEKGERERELGWAVGKGNGRMGERKVRERDLTINALNLVILVVFVFY